MLSNWKIAGLDHEFMQFFDNIINWLQDPSGFLKKQSLKLGSLPISMTSYLSIALQTLQMPLRVCIQSQDQEIFLKKM